MEHFSFTSNSFTCNGKTYPAHFSIDEAGAVTVHVSGVVENGKEIHVLFAPDHAAYSAAKAAALAADQPAAPAAEVPETAAPIQPEPEAAAPAEIQPAPDPAPAALETVTPAEIPEGKKTRGPVPEKTFINDSIQGKGYKIFFDGSTSRTRVIFDADPTAAARAALEKAGFYFSAAMNSWNKKLTFKAYRAALALNTELSALYA